MEPTAVERPDGPPHAAARLLFLTRKFPPAVGGMERLAEGLARALAREADTRVLAWGGSQAALPLWLPWAFARAAWAIRADGVSHVHLGDALLAPLGLALKQGFGVRVSATACGLDVTWPWPPYQRVMPSALAALDRVVAISEATRAACLARGVAPAACVVVPPGIDPRPPVPADRGQLARLAGRELDGRLLATVGRLVPRKGVAWFVREVLPRLPADVLYLVAGEGPERRHIREAASAAGVADRTVLLGRLDEPGLATLYAGADAFVMPNRLVPGDMEGFGLVAIEAAAAGLPVVAADLEGLRTAIADPAIGRLVRPDDVPAWVAAIAAALDAPPAARAAARVAVERRFGWAVVGPAYREALGL